MKNSQRHRIKPHWLAWAVTLGELILLSAFTIALGQYWLMLPVWIRSTAGFGLALALLTVAFRFYQFLRAKKRSSQPSGAPAETVI